MSDSLWPHGLSPPGSSVHGLLQTRILEWVAIPSPGDLPDLWIKPALQANSLLAKPPGKPLPEHVCSMLSCFSHVQLCNAMDCSPPGSSVHRILQARILEWFPYPSSGNLPDPGIGPAFLMFPALAGGFFTTGTTIAWPHINLGWFFSHWLTIEVEVSDLKYLAFFKINFFHLCVCFL